MTRGRTRRWAARISTAVLFTSAVVRAQEAPSTAPPSRSLSLSEAIAFAHEHHPALRAAVARVATQAESAKVPRSQWLPTFGVNAQVFVGSTNNTSALVALPTYIALPRVGGTPVTSKGNFDPYPSTLIAVGANQEVFDFGRIAAEAAEADAHVDLAKRSEEERRLDVDFNVEEAYFAVFAARAVLITSQQAYDRARAHRDLAKAGVDVGLRSPVELTRTEALLGHYDVGRIRADGNIKIARSVLAAAVGAPEETVDVAGAVPTPQEMPTLANAMQRAAARNPLILKALASLKAQEDKTRAICAQLRPNLSFTATFSGRAGGVVSGTPRPVGDGWLPSVPNWDVGLMLNWSVFDGVILARKNASQSDEKVRKEELSLSRQTQIAALQQAYIAVEVARDALPALRQSMEAARANYAQSDARFTAGLGDSVELADAENIRTDAEIKLALGQFEVARTRAAFGRIIAEGLDR